MAEYTKLSPEDTGAYGFTKLLSENVPFSKKPFIPSVFKKMESSDKLELVNFGNKNDTLTSSVNNNNNLLSLSINDNNQDNINRSRKGKMKMLFYNKDNIPLIVLGPDWLGSLIIIIALIILMIFYFNYFKDSMNPTIKFYGIIISFIHASIYLMCFLINPGIPPKDLWIENYFKNKTNDSNKNYSIKICKDCKIIIESTENIEHCKKCDICIMDMSHHSVWIGKCIGKKNKYYYYCFKFMSAVLGMYLVFSFISVLFYKGNNTKE
jgi:hypothetical protein